MVDYDAGYMIGLIKYGIISVARNFVWGGQIEQRVNCIKYMYIIIDIYIYRWGGLTPYSRIHVCHNTYRAIAAVIAYPTFAKGAELPQS